MQRLFVLTLVLSLFLPTAAFAHSTDVEVEFDTLALGTYDGELSLEYTISSRSWHRLQRHDVTPRIDIYAPTHSCDGDPVYEDVELYDRSDVLILDHRDFRNATTVRVGFSQRTYRNSRTTIRLSGSLTRTTELTFENDVRQARSDRSHRDRSHRDHSCSSHTRRNGTRSRSRDSCEFHSDRRHEHSSRLQSRIVDACSENTSFSSDHQQCLQRAAHLPASDVISVIGACGEQTSFSSDFHNCMKTARDFRTAPTPSIHACGEATSFGSDFASCLKAASKFQHDASAVVHSCDNSHSMSSNIPQCVDQARF